MAAALEAAAERVVLEADFRAGAAEDRDSEGAPARAAAAKAAEESRGLLGSSREAAVRLWTAR